MRKIRLTGVLMASAVAVASAGCGSDPSTVGDPTSTSQAETFTVQVASYDLAADAPQRFLVGLLAGEGGLVVGGTVDLEFTYAGDGTSSTTSAVGPVVPGVSAEFVPVADGIRATSGPKVREGDEGVGVYEVNGVEFPAAGFWEVTVTASFAGRVRSSTAAFSVAETAAVPVAGDPAPRTVNLLPGDPDAPPKAVDSRAEPDGTVPDPRLHRLTVEQAIATGKPTLVVISTPVFCVSQFCGPITETVDSIASDFGDRANFVHIEVWRDFEGKTLNKGAAEWIWPNPTVEPREPWVFLVDGAGTVLRRWDNVANGEQVRTALGRVA